MTAESGDGMLRRVFLVSIALLCLLVPTVVLADTHNPQRIMPAEVMKKLAAGETIVFLDTRTTADWETGTVMIANALRVKNNEVLTKILREVPRERLIVTYCT